MRKELRFFAYQEDGVWVAHCVDFSLSAQADTFPEVREKVHAQVLDFCNYINSQASDPAFQHQLLNRKAPLATRAWYWVAVVANALRMPVRRSAASPPKRWTERAQPRPC